jgi:hypothetical protein
MIHKNNHKNMVAENCSIAVLKPAFKESRKSQYDYKPSSWFLIVQCC